MKTSFFTGPDQFRLNQFVIKNWNNIIDKIHFTTEDFMKRFVLRLSKK